MVETSVGHQNAIADDDALPATNAEAPPRRPDRRAIPLFNAAELQGQPIPDRKWHVRDLVPDQTVTLLSGDGGLGKTQIALQLSCATLLGRPWLGRSVTQGRALVLTAEDSKDELHRRLAAIAAHEAISLRDLDGLIVAPLAGEPDAVLATASARGSLRTSKLFGSVDKYLANKSFKLLVLDPLADLFAGDENNRAEARQFITLLRGLAIRRQVAVVLTAHPSLAGMANKSGTSGSTAWNASVRSRLYLETPTRDPERADPDARILRVVKSNYGPRGLEIPIRWRRGVFVVAEQLDTESAAESNLAALDKIDASFVEMLAIYEKEGRNVSTTGPTFAPTMFAKDSRSGGIKKHQFSDSMNRLFSCGRVKIIEFGPPSHRRRRITLVDSEASI